jgi:predicted ATP-grasp superfamily ATP-dependent carboligase
MTSNRKQQPTAVILGGDVNGLGVARSLAAHNVPLLIVDTDLRRPTMRTRYGRKIAIGALSGATLLESLRALREQFREKPVLFLTQEASVATLSPALSAIAEIFHVTFATDEVITPLLDKTRFHALAEKHGFTVPRSQALHAGSTHVDLMELRFPCILKPATKDAGYAGQFAKAYRVNGAQEAFTLWNKMKTLISTAIIQEWIEGGDSDVYFCLQYRSRSGTTISFCGRKTLQWPPLVGGTATCIPAPDVKDTLISQTSGFFSKVGLSGLCSMEYKRDSRDGKFYMVEPTVGRTDYQEEIAALNGVNIPLAAYCELAGLPQPGGKAIQPKAWRDSFNYRKALAKGAKDALSEIAPQTSITDAYFRLGDPMPYVAANLAPLRAKLFGRLH